MTSDTLSRVVNTTGEVPGSTDDELRSRSPSSDRESRSRDYALDREIALRDHVIEALSTQLAEAHKLNAAILSSKSWRLTLRYARFKAMVTTLGRMFRRDANHSSPNGPTYAEWVARYDSLSNKDRSAIRHRIRTLRRHPKIAIIVYTNGSSQECLAATIQSVRRQLYENWEVWLIDERRQAVVKRFGADNRLRIITPENGETTTAINRAVAETKSEFILFAHAGDQLSAHALYMFVEELNRFSADLIYSDEDTVDASGLRSNPYFKPDWNPDLFYSGDFLSHSLFFRRSLVMELDGLRSVYGESALYDLAMRAVELAPAFRIRHIPRVLYHRLAGAAPDEQTSEDGALKVVADHLQRTGVPAIVTNGQPGVHRVRYPVPDVAPLVSLHIATRDRAELLRPLVAGILNETDYPSVEVVIVDNQSSDQETVAYLRGIDDDPRVTVISYDQTFNFSAINNLAVRSSRGEVIGFLNNDLKIINPDWLREMVSHALRPEVGAVGAKLYYPDDSIQHAGIIVGLGALAGYVHRHSPRDAPGHGRRLQRIQNLSAVTAACMIMRRSVFDEAGGFDEVNLPVAYNDVDLCLRIRQLGYRILWTPYAELYHLESASRPSDLSTAERARYDRECAHLKSRWQTQLTCDPAYNPNLTLETEDFSVASPPRVRNPWDT